MTHTNNDERLEQEAMDQLAKANPVIPTDDDPNAEALLQRITSEAPTRRAGWQQRAVLAVGGLAALAVVAIGSFAVLGGGGDGSGDGGQVPADQVDGEPTLDPAGGGASGSCLAFSPEELRLRQHAFHGEATDVTDTAVTFEVIEWYSAEGESPITLVVDTALSSDTYRDFDFAEGEEYLVSGDAEFAWGCGYTRPYSESEAEIWEAAFAG